MAFTRQPTDTQWARKPVVAALAAIFLVADGAWAQDPSLPAVTVQGSQSPPVAEVGGLGDTPLREAPLSATVVDEQALRERGTRRLSELTGFDASATDSYNAPGYWDFLTVRGYTLDNRYNWRREGLPISAETVIGLENKARLEVLRGTSGMQAGTSAPGGLVNLVVKRPPARGHIADLRLEATSRASLLAAADLGGRAGAGDALGWRLNVAHERLRPAVRNLDGRRHLMAGAAQARLGRDTVLDAELEWSRHEQPSQAGFSLLGDRLPAVPDPRLNLNNQPWSQTSRFDGLTGSLRLEQALGTDWRWVAQLGSQRLRSDDRIAFAFGCDAEGNYDRYCSDGSVDLYDFRSENERRRQHAAQLAVYGRLQWGGVEHRLGAVLLHSQARQRMETGAFNYVGIGTVDGLTVLPADPSRTDPNTNRDERSLELSLHDHMRLDPQWSGWVGLRHTRLARSSVRTNGSRATAWRDQVTTPWLALSWRFDPAHMVYASWGQGVESQVVPNRASQYTNAGQALPPLKSRQWELGVKGRDGWLGAPLDWQLAWFRIHRPVSNIDACGRLGISPCTGAFDGGARHQGLEANAQWRSAAWRLAAGLTWLDARREGSVVEPGTNGQRPTNVPRHVVRGQLGWKPAGWGGAEWVAQLSHEGRRNVLPDGSLQLPAWTRLDLALHAPVTVAGHAGRWTLAIDNLANRRYWKESPYQFGHVYLYPGAARQIRLALTVNL